MNIVLTGFMGSGKTAVGKRLSKRLGWRFVDVDQLIESHAGMSIARIFAERGESVFRRYEQRCLSQVLDGCKQVIATGGGAFVNPRNREKLKLSGPVVCLTAKPRIILERVERNAGTRPLLKDSTNPLERIRSLMAQRSSAYAQADCTVDTSQLRVDQVVERLVRTLSPLVCKSWQYLLDHTEALSARYRGKYVVVVDNRIVASGESQLEAFQKAAPRDLENREAGIYYIPLPEESITAL